jgi:putative copper resistance protein D
MAAHMLLSMLVPILLVLGAPTTLALRALPTAGKGNPPGPREWLLAGLHCGWSRFFTHPVVATVMFVSGFYVLYFGGIFDAAVSHHGAHLLMNLHFLMSGYLFYWVVIGIDPAPRVIPSLGKIGMVFASIPLHAFFGVMLMGSSAILGERFYRSLQLPWHTDLGSDQRLGGSIAWAAGEVPLVVVMMALLIQWQRSDRRISTRLDRAADRDHDADMTAYNAMLAELARRDSSGGVGR